MALIKCPECGKDVSDKTDKCVHCGFPLNTIGKKAEVTTENFNTVNYPNNVNKPKSNKKKDSTLSIWACVLAIFTCTLPIAFILALVDLCTNDKSKSHKGSIFALIMSVLLGIVCISSILGSGGSNIGTNEKQLDILLCQDENISVYLDHVKGGKLYVRYVNYSDDDINISYNRLIINEDKYFPSIFVSNVYSGEDSVVKLDLYDKDGGIVKYNYDTGTISGKFSYFKGGIGLTTDLEFKDIKF